MPVVRVPIRTGRFTRARVDGVIHADTNRAAETSGTSHFLLCGLFRRYTQPGDTLLGKDTAVTCLWCASEPV